MEGGKGGGRGEEKGKERKLKGKGGEWVEGRKDDVRRRRMERDEGNEWRRYGKKEREGR